MGQFLIKTKKKITKKNNKRRKRRSREREREREKGERYWCCVYVERSGKGKCAEERAKVGREIEWMNKWKDLVWTRGLCACG